MDKLTNILVGVDFSPASRAALVEAIRIAGWHRARCRAEHVIEFLILSELEETLGLYQPDLYNELREDARRSWEKLTKGMDLGSGVEFTATIGSPVATLLAQAREHKTDLLVLGAKGLGGFAHLGPVAASCVRHAPCKTLVVRNRAAGPFRTVVACIDFSPTSRDALEQAIRICAQDSATLIALHAFDPPWQRSRTQAPGAGPAYRDEYTRALQERLESFCTPLAHELNYLKARYHVTPARSHARGIIDFAKEAGADLVVLGTRGHTTLKELLLGSTAERVLRDAGCSVLAVKPAR